MLAKNFSIACKAGDIDYVIGRVAGEIFERNEAELLKPIPRDNQVEILEESGLDTIKAEREFNNYYRGVSQTNL
jgi:hypothetical protein